MSFQVGETIGDYEIVGVLGRGGMGKVFRVRNQISDRIEAMKIVLPDLEGDRDLAERFLREIKVHATLDHPNIARLRTALRIDNRIVMILELVDGAGLDEMLDRGPIPAADAIRYGAQILSALAYAHSLGVIHRDLKPANIIVNRAGSVKLTDFGIARAAGAPKITRPGLAFGSLYYMAPEQFGGGAVDARSDLYSLGITLFEMLTGARPIEGDSEYSIMKAHVEKIPVAPADMDPELAAILLKSLAKDPGRRFQSAEEFRSALELFGRGALSQASRSAERDYAGVAPSLDPAILARVEAYLLPALGPIDQAPGDQSGAAIGVGFGTVQEAGGADSVAAGARSVSTILWCGNRIFGFGFEVRHGSCAGLGRSGAQGSQATTGGIHRADRRHRRGKGGQASAQSTGAV